MDILEGLDGKEKMSKSLGNYVAITDEPNDMFGKIMSIPDALIPRYFALTTYSPLEEVKKIQSDLETGEAHPKELKMRLAREIVAIYHGDALAQKAEQAFTDTFSKGKIPENVPEIGFDIDSNIVDALIKSESVASKTEARRLIESGAVTFLDEDIRISEISHVVRKGTYRVGKHRFFKVV